MSRGFVKEDDLEHAGTDVPERLISAQTNYVTTNGYRLLEQQANTLEQQRIVLSVEKDDQQAQQQLAVVNRDLRYVAARLESAQVIKPATTKPDTSSQVLFGATVMVEDESGSKHSYEIVGEDEADIKMSKISWTSPLAKALIGQKIGETVTWARPAGNTALKIINIKYI